jgi:hypothetical protein
MQPPNRLIVMTGHEFSEACHRPKKEIHRVERTEAPSVTQPLERFIRAAEKAER